MFVAFRKKGFFISTTLSRYQAQQQPYRPFLVTRFFCASSSPPSSSTTTTPKKMSGPANISFEHTRANAPDHVLVANEDKYDGIIISSKSLPSTDEEFTSKLQDSLTYWRSINRKGIWLKVPIEKSSFIPIAVKEGFIFHHAEKDYVMMCLWLPPDESRLPQSATHQVGVGCVVIHEGKLLLVQERNGPLRGTGIWKLPTGLADIGEDIAAAAEREILEETGITATFQKLLCFRQAHNILFGKSDLFYVCVLKPESFVISHQEIEIVAADWKEPHSLFGQTFFQKSPLHTLINELIAQEIANQTTRGEDQAKNQLGMKEIKMPIGFRPGLQGLYYPAEFHSEKITQYVNNTNTTNSPPPPPAASS
jgi:ADP-ribose pyrophosphatase YjhB (NUDIX family)